MTGELILAKMGQESQLQRERKEKLKMVMRSNGDEKHSDRI